MTSYKVLPLHQPYASLVVYGEKKIETRARNTKIRGTVLIHACKNDKMFYDLKDQSPFKETLTKIYSANDIYFGHFGAIIGSVDIIDSGIMIFNDDNSKFIKGIKFYDVNDLEEKFGIYDILRFGWILQNPRILKIPIPFKANQGWNKYETEDELEFI